MEAWKIMLWIAFILVSFAVFAGLTDTSLASSNGIALLIAAVIAALFAHFGTNMGYDLGRRLVEGSENDDE